MEVLGICVAKVSEQFIILYYILANNIVMAEYFKCRHFVAWHIGAGWVGMTFLTLKYLYLQSSPYSLYLLLASIFGHNVLGEIQT